jgi:hypothetical protein
MANVPAYLQQNWIQTALVPFVDNGPNGKQNTLRKCRERAPT